MRIVVSLLAGLMVGMLGACASSGSGEISDHPPSLAVADAAMRSGSPAMALQICTDTLQREPGDLKAQLCQGNALAALNQTASAEAAYAKALQIDGHSSAALVGLGRLRLSQDPAAAESLFVRATDTDDSNAIAWNNLGIARDLQGRHLQAQIAYRRALEITPNAESVKVNLALSLAISGRADEGIRLMHSLNRDPASDPRLRANLAAVMAMGGQYDAAAKLLAQDLSPDEVDQTIAGYRDMVAHDRAAQAAPAGAPTAAAPAAPMYAAPQAIGQAASGRASGGQLPYVAPSSAPWAVGPGGQRRAAAPAAFAPAPAPVPAPAPEASAAPQAPGAQLPYAPPSPAPRAIGPDGGQDVAASSPVPTPAPAATPARAASSALQLPYVVPASAPWSSGPGAKAHMVAVASASPAPVSTVASPAPVSTSASSAPVSAALPPAASVSAAPAAEPAAARPAAASSVQQAPYEVPSSAPWESGPPVPHPVVARTRPKVPAASASAPAIASGARAEGAKAEARVTPAFVPPSAELPTSTSP